MTIFFRMLRVLLLVALAAAKDLPRQIHVTLDGPTALTVVWTTHGHADSTVRYGRWPNRPVNIAYGESPGESYSTPDGYRSGYVHQVTLYDLEPGQLYTYSCGDDAHGLSLERAVRVPGGTAFTVVGDMGATRDTAATLASMLLDRADVALIVGDLSYANGDQARWDAWGDLTEPLFATQPVMMLPGNHDLEDESGLLAYRIRYPSPGPCYAFRLGLATIVMVDAYAGLLDTGSQYNWLASTLETVDRRVTPWLVVALHVPLYSSNQLHHTETERARAVLEPLLVFAKVDLVLSGHVHAYERTHPVQRARRKDGAPVYVTVGTGGNAEGRSGDWLIQPAWSASRMPVFGHGRFEAANATHARWEFRANWDAGATDAVWLEHDPV